MNPSKLGNNMANQPRPEVAEPHEPISSVSSLASDRLALVIKSGQPFFFFSFFTTDLGPAIPSLSLWHRFIELSFG